MKKKSLFLIPTLMLLASCATTVPGTPYEPNLDLDRQYHETDAGFVIDGVLDEEQYQSLEYFTGKKVSGDQWAEVLWSMYFGDQGVYIIIDVKENTQIYVNPYRETYINSGIEMYLMPNTATKYDSPYTLEVDMVADGTLLIKRNIGGSSYGRCDIEDANNAVLATVQKERVDGVSGYTHELFIPHTFFQRLGFIKENQKVDALNADIVHIASQNYEGSNSGTDRVYYSFAAHQLDAGNAWTRPDKIYKFVKGIGFKAYKLEFNVTGPGTASELHGYAYAVPFNSLTLLFKPNGGRLANIASIKINNTDYVGNLQRSSEEATFQLAFDSTFVTRNLNINVVFQ